MKLMSDLNCSDYEEMLNIPTHLVIILSQDGKILKSNIEHKKILGWNLDEILGKSLHFFMHEGDHEVINKKLIALISGKELSVTLTTRCCHRDGTLRWISWTAITKDDLLYAIGTDVTKMMETETETALIQNTIVQKEYQTRFTTFFEQSTLAMEIYSLDGFPLAVNKAWEVLFDTTRDQLKGYNILKDPLVRHSTIWSYVQKAYQGESVEVPAFWYDPGTLNKPGRARWLEAWISPVKDEFGGIREIALILKDVTEKIETQKALVKSIIERKATEEKFQIISNRLSMAVKAGHIGIWEWIPETNHVYWDETTELMYGYVEGTFPRTLDALNERIHPEDKDYLWRSISQAIEQKRPYRIDHRIIKKDGVQRWVQESGMALYDEKGKAYHMLGTVMDITERIEAEEDQKFLSQSSELLNISLDYKEILKTLSGHAINYFCDGVFVDQLLPDGEIKRLMIVHDDQEMKAKLEKLDKDFPSHHENNPMLKPLFNGQLMFNEDSDVFLEQIRTTHSEIYYLALKDLKVKSSIRIRLKGRESVLGMMTFITMKGSSKNLTKRHIWLAEELTYRASMAFENALIHQASQEAIRSRDEFLSIASHELRTPLQSLTLQNQMRKRNLDKKMFDVFTPDKVSGMIEADLRHLMRINRLIDDMLDISHIRAGKLTFMKEKVEFCSFVKDVLERFRPQVESKGCYMTAVYTDSLVSNIDIYRIEQVIVNLLTNAMKYGAGTPIKVEVCQRQNKIQLHVHDQGPGIKEEDTERIFERFERAISSNEVSGLGLGLYISRQIMTQNQGALYVRSIIGKGATFTLELPLEE
ncbi:MAG: PAS domain S-box protein [Bdellovibrionales bacterium]|nr:PAS domain S-box protein [Bdellovibrionales bacterium]